MTNLFIANFWIFGAKIINLLFIYYTSIAPEFGMKIHAELYFLRFFQRYAIALLYDIFGLLLTDGEDLLLIERFLIT